MTIEKFIEARALEWEQAANEVVRLENMFAREGGYEYQWAKFRTAPDGRLIGSTHTNEPGAPSPKQVLSLVAALRKIAGRHEPENWQWYDDPQVQHLVSGVRCEECSGDIGLVLWPCDEIRAIAAIWSDHPEYRRAWMSA